MGTYKMPKKPKLDPEVAAVPAFITFKDAEKDGVSHVEVYVSAVTPVSKKKGDFIEWRVTNTSSVDLEVKVIDFYATRILQSNPNGTLGGGYPFADGAVPKEIIVPADGIPVKTKAKKCDGDAGYAYKYSVVARDVTDPKNPGQWFLVKDPELELDL